MILSRFSYTWKLNNAALTPVPGHCAPSGLSPAGAWRSTLASARSSTVRSRRCQPAARSVSTSTARCTVRGCTSSIPAQLLSRLCAAVRATQEPMRVQLGCAQEQNKPGVCVRRDGTSGCLGFGTPPVLCGACCPATRSKTFFLVCFSFKAMQRPVVGCIQRSP